MIEFCAKPNMPNSYGLTALVKSSVCGYSEIVELLLDSGANPNSYSNGYSALIQASYYGYCDIIEILINYGADIILQTIEGNTLINLL